MCESRVLRLTLAVALLPLLACAGGGGGGDAEDGSAASTIRSFYDHLNAGRHEDAKALYSEEARRNIFPDARADKGFREWASAETHEGGLTAFEVIGETEVENGITIEFELRFSDGETARRQVTVSDEDGAWRLGFIG